MVLGVVAGGSRLLQKICGGEKFIKWATSKEYIALVGETNGWVTVPPGTRKSTYANPKYKSAAPFANFVLQAIENADPKNPTAKPVPYTGVQFAAIDEFQSIGAEVGQLISGALAGDMSVEEALEQGQRAADRAMRRPDTTNPDARTEPPENPPFAFAEAGFHFAASAFALAFALMKLPVRAVFVAPATGLLLVWMAVPLAMTLWFSFQRYNLLKPERRGFAGLDNYEFLLTDPSFWTSIVNTLLMVGWILAVTVTLGVLLAVLFNAEFRGRGIARLLVIAPFFIMPAVSGLIWKNMLMHPVNGLFAHWAALLGAAPVDWFGDLPMTSIVVIVSWQWTPFALLILLTALQSLDKDQLEAARLDGAGPVAAFFFVVLPHLRRAIGIVVMMETIFLLAIFAEILVTTSGGPGLATTNLAYLVYKTALFKFDIGGASAGGVAAIVLANIVALFLIRAVARTLET